MPSYTLAPTWLVVRTHTLHHRSEDVALLHTLRSVAFAQMLEPPLWDGTHTLIEGRPRAAAAEALDALGFERMPLEVERAAAPHRRPT